jgi:hypothetical protein
MQLAVLVRDDLLPHRVTAGVRLDIDPTSNRAILSAMDE